MAASLVTVHHVHARQKTRDEHHDTLQIIHTAPADENLILKRGFLWRQTMSSAGVIYAKREVTLTEDVIYFGKIGTGELLDYIPLLEIKQESLFVSSDSKHHPGWNFTRTSQGMRVLSTEDCAKTVSPNVHGGGGGVSQ